MKIMRKAKRVFTPKEVAIALGFSIEEKPLGINSDVKLYKILAPHWWGVDLPSLYTSIESAEENFPNFELDNGLVLKILGRFPNGALYPPNEANGRKWTCCMDIPLLSRWKLDLWQESETPQGAILSAFMEWKRICENE